MNEEAPESTYDKWNIYVAICDLHFSMVKEHSKL
jgi:hypothetical protein